MSSTLHNTFKAKKLGKHTYGIKLGGLKTWNIRTKQCTAVKVTYWERMKKIYNIELLDYGFGNKKPLSQAETHIVL